MDLPDIYLTAFVPSVNVGLVIIVVILVLFSAFFSSAETAFSSVNKVSLELEAEKGKKSAKMAVSIAENFNKTLSTLLVGNNIVNILMATLSVRLFAGFIQNPNIADLASTGVITIVVLIFGEILPKSLAKKYSCGVCLTYAMIVSFLNIILKPITLPFYGLQALFSKNDEGPTVTEGELGHIIDTMSEQGVLEDEEAELISSVLDLNDKTVEDIMVPRIDMIGVNINDDIEKIKKVFFDTQYSRLPVYVDDKDNIIGILHERDFFTKLLKKQKINIKSLAREAVFVSKSMKVDALINELQSKKSHMAIVSGEYGETAGIVTMEDALEELVGEIYDEHDEANAESLVLLEDGTYRVDATMEIAELFDKLDVGNPPEDKYMKVSSFIYEETEDIPEPGMVVTYKSDFTKRDEENDKYVDYSKMLYFTVDKVEDRRIISVRLKIEDVTESDLE